ncbi:MAG: ABC transporter substrate-binding protein [Xenococcaceae cyanobacterium MO_167.B27]|nr:ABC transporter substrate-binding protein [Xenococcaceae cyanobacterium MO_167.B27]
MSISFLILSRKMAQRDWIWVVGIGCLILMMILWLGSYQSSKMPKTEFRQLGAIFPLTGSAAQIGIWQQRGIELAIERLNQNLTPPAKPFQIIYEDSQGDPKTGVAALQKIISTANPPVIFSSLSSVSSAILPILERHQTVSLLLAVSLPGITERSEWTFRCHLGSDNEAEAMAAYLATTPIRRVAVAYINDEFGVGAVAVFRQVAEDKKLVVTATEAYNKDGSDFRTLVTKLRRTNPEAIYVIGYVNSSVLLIKQLRELGVKVPVLGNLTLSLPSFLQLGGQALEGAIFTVTPFDVQQGQESPELNSFVRAYQDRYQEEPNVYTAFAYDAMMMVAQAAQNRGFSAEGIREGLLEIHDYQGIMGELNVESNGEIEFPTRIVQNQGGAIVPVESSLLKTIE